MFRAENLETGEIFTCDDLRTLYRTINTKLRYTTYLNVCLNKKVCGDCVVLTKNGEFYGYFTNFSLFMPTNPKKCFMRFTRSNILLHYYANAIKNIKESI